MPNWSSTSLVVRGPEEEIKAFYEGCRIPATDDGFDKFQILEGHLPCPQELRDTTATFAFWDEVPKQWKEMLANGEWTQAEYDERVAKNAEILKQQEEARAKYGVKDWYDWQIAKWGVKWGDCDTDFHTAPTPYGHKDLWMTSASFQTPWGVAVAGFVALSEKFPNCLFMLDSDEEAGFFAGIEMMHGGEVVFEDYYEPCEYPEELDWDDDDQVEAYEEWKSNHEDKIADRAEVYLQNRDWLPMPVAPVKPKEAVKPKGKAHVWK